MHGRGGTPPCRVENDGGPLVHRSSVEVASRGSLMGVPGVTVGVVDMPAGELDIAWGDRPPGGEVPQESVELRSPRGCAGGSSRRPVARSRHTLVTAYPRDQYAQH